MRLWAVFGLWVVLVGVCLVSGEVLCNNAMTDVIGLTYEAKR